MGGSIKGGRLAQGEPLDPRRSFKVIGGGGDDGGSSSAVATTTTGSFLTGIFGSVVSDVMDLLKKLRPFSISASALRTNGKLSESSDADFLTGNSVSLSRFLGLHRSKVGSPEAATVSEIWRVNAACLTESDLERGSLVFGVGERRSPNFLLAARLMEEKRPSFSGGLSAGAVEGPGTGSGAGRGEFPSR